MRMAADGTCIAIATLTRADTSTLFMIMMITIKAINCACNAIGRIDTLAAIEMITIAILNNRASAWCMRMFVMRK